FRICVIISRCVVVYSLFYFSLLPPHPVSTLFPYTTLFRSLASAISICRNRLSGTALDDSTIRFDWRETTSYPGWRQSNLIVESSDRKSTRLNSSHVKISYAVFCLKKKNNRN